MNETREDIKRIKANNKKIADILSSIETDIYPTTAIKEVAHVHTTYGARFSYSSIYLSFINRPDQVSGLFSDTYAVELGAYDSTDVYRTLRIIPFCGKSTAALAKEVKDAINCVRTRGF